MKLRTSHKHRFATFARIMGFLAIPATIASAILANGWDAKLIVLLFGTLVSAAYHLLASSLPTIWDINNSKH